MIVRVLIILLFSAFQMTSFGQSVNELIQTAYKLQLAGDHEQAKSVINKAVELDNGSKDETVWHIRGFIYKDLFVKNRQNESASKYRSESVSSFINSRKYDKKGVLEDQNEKALKYLAISYFNDASDLIKAHDPDRMSLAEDQYANYKDIVISLRPDTTLTDKDVEYFLAMSTAHRKIYESNRERYDQHWQVSNDFMDKVLDLDPNSFEAWFSLGVSYYNRGAYNLERLPYVDVYDLVEIQSESMRSIEMALPFMLKAYEIDSTKIDVIKALKIITFNLNKEEESEHYQGILEKQDSGLKK